MKKNTSTLGIILYVLAGLGLLAGIILVLYGLTFRPGLEGSLMIVRNAFGPLAGQLIDMLIGGIQSAVLLFAGVVLALSACVFAAGRLTGRSRSLAQRVGELEARLAALESPTSQE